MNGTSNKIDQFLKWESNKFIKLAQKGLIIFILGLLIINIISISTSFDYGEYQKEVIDFFRIIDIIAFALFFIGVLMFILSMFTIAIYDEKMHIYLRVALIIALGLIISIPLYTGYGI